MIPAAIIVLKLTIAALLGSPPSPTPLSRLLPNAQPTCETLAPARWLCIALRAGGRRPRGRWRASRTAAARGEEIGTLLLELGIDGVGLRLGQAATADRLVQLALGGCQRRADDRLLGGAVGLRQLSKGLAAAQLGL